MSSFFGGGGGAQPSSASNQQLKMAKAEVKMYSDLFNKMCSLCFEKCVARYNDTDLNLGEMSCVDRCVGKYLESHMKVGEVLKNFEEQAKQQQQAQAGIPPTSG